MHANNTRPLVTGLSVQRLVKKGMDHLTLCRVKSDGLFGVPAPYLSIDHANVEVFKSAALGALGQLTHALQHAFDDLLALLLEVFRFRNRL